MWRGVSLRKLAVLLFAPMLSETLATLFTSWMVLRAAKTMGYQEWQHMLIPAAGSLGYALSALAAGRWVTPRRAPALMIGAIVTVTVLGLAGMAIDRFAAFVAISTLIGVCFGHYYTPFQIHMTHVKPFHTVAWSVGFYNIAWGVGAAAGPFLGSALRTAPLSLLISLGLSLALIHTVLNIVSLYAPPPREQVEPEAPFASTRRQRRVGLAAFFAVGLVIRGLYITLWPGLGTRNGWSDAQIGLGQFCMFAPVPLGAVLWAKLRRRLQEPWIMLASMAVGWAGFALLPVVTSFTAALVCVTCVGVMESCVVFHAIYYMNTHTDARGRGRSVGVFEMTAGLASILGPVTLGLLASRPLPHWLPYAFGCTILAAMLAYIALARLQAGPESAKARV